MACKRTTFPFRAQKKRSSVEKLQEHNFPWAAPWRFPSNDVSSRETTRPEPELKKAPFSSWPLENQKVEGGSNWWRCRGVLFLVNR